MELNVFVLLSFSGFKFLGGETENQEKKRRRFVVSTNICWVLSMLPGTRPHVLPGTRPHVHDFPAFKITFDHAKETSRCVLADSSSGPRKGISAKVSARTGTAP